MVNKESGERERKGIETVVLYRINEELQKKLKEEGKNAYREQKSKIFITDEDLKKKIKIDENGECELDLRNFYIPECYESWEKDELGIRKDIYSVKNVYKSVYMDKIINSEKDIIAYIEQKRKEAIEEVEKNRKKAEKEYERRRKEVIERRKKEKEEEERKKREEEVKKKRIKSISWIKELKAELEKRTSTNAEIERFCKKFELTRDMLNINTISEAPFVSISAEIDLEDCKLKLYNYVFEEYNEEYEEDWTVHFSDKRRLIAEILAKIFNGKVVEVAQKYDVYLNVVTEHDTINIACSEKEYLDC